MWAGVLRFATQAAFWLGLGFVVKEGSEAVEDVVNPQIDKYRAQTKTMIPGWAIGAAIVGVVIVAALFVANKLLPSTVQDNLKSIE